ncbi:hypothetical protein MOF38_15170 [Bacillus haynesii]|uniref:hypothetical protein n=1 Tax=Bacillus haynesii TaxID=1925021 RepID=UPI00227E1C67|nr:hypothetical protein [Bacillus haynesii]MCY9401118.1 hypothetical protein [Bacillus haynesii]
MKNSFLAPRIVWVLFFVQIREKSDKKGDKMGDFFYSTLSYDRDKKNEREYRVQEGEPADTDLLHTDVVQLIGGPLFYWQEWETHLSLIKGELGCIE